MNRVQDYYFNASAACKFRAIFIILKQKQNLILNSSKFEWNIFLDYALTQYYFTNTNKQI